MPARLMTAGQLNTGPEGLQVTLGQHSDRGRKEINQDFHGAVIPSEPQRSLKGIALAMSDGISSSAVSQIASETAVSSFLDDYYCTSEAWSVRTSGLRVMAATNSWLHAQNQQSAHRFDKDRGYVCTLSALVLRGQSAHVFHVGDTRIYRIQGNSLEQLCNDHRLWLSSQESYLSRAMGFEPGLDPDYQTFTLREGDLFILATDGVYEHVSADSLLQQLRNADDLDQAAAAIVRQATDNGSPDNLSIQLLRVDTLPGKQPGGDPAQVQYQADSLPLPPQLQEGSEFDGYRIEREIHASSRSHAYLAVDLQTDTQVILKTPSIDLSGDPAYLERFLLEEWIARRINSVHVLRAAPVNRERQFLYTATEFIEGQTLAQWLIDNPRPGLEAVRDIIEQVAKGLRAFHRMEMLHQDIKPDNIMIDRNGTVKIIDFGSTRVAGLVELNGDQYENPIPGSALYSAPEYFLGQPAEPRSDLFSLGVLAFHMLSGRYPYDTRLPRARNIAAQRRLNYRSVLREDSDVPAWVDATLHKAVHLNPLKRYQHLSEFLHDFRHPNKAYLASQRPPLLERNPVAFWQGVALLQLITIIALLYLLN